ncbi:hypothetical protein AVL62_02905 [Serinicoccus chungangensis]|uniref:DUF3105 domain-containing protein n=1 Tax=Serinicoccus chungangensis TaxID=767452 RepID=A0A0W8I639_9MICO|nr:DUF3105 domain-containing protein [Serinicoccus chungangensis]KUG53731.1 hypothetical protein AVL62_02905 [Serinicoccus chungangensis]
MPRPDRTPAASDRAAKAAKIQKAGKAADRRRGVLIWGSAVAVVVLIVGAVVFAVVRDSPAFVDLAGVEDFENTPANHVNEQIDYDSPVPPGGPHHPAWWDCGVYEEEVPTEHAVHSLEHGAVWLTYQPDLPADQVEVLAALGDEEYMLVSPVADQESPVMATSWNHQLELDTADERTLQAFIREYRQAPDTPELGAACTGGTVTDLVARQ